jgi:hypothetical protein
MATIPRSHAKKIAALKRSLTLCTVYTLDNQFCGQPTDPANAWAALERSAGARLTVDSTGTRYTVHVHSNRWYELCAGGQEAADPVADFGDALSRSGAWMASGAPAHGFAGDPAERWCRQCGCGAGGWQPQPGGQPPDPCDLAGEAGLLIADDIPGTAAWALPGRPGEHLAWSGPGARVALHTGGEPGRLGTPARNFTGPPAAARSAACRWWANQRARRETPADVPPGTGAPIGTCNCSAPERSELNALTCANCGYRLNGEQLAALDASLPADFTATEAAVTLVGVQEIHAKL